VDRSPAEERRVGTDVDGRPNDPTVALGRIVAAATLDAARAVTHAVALGWWNAILDAEGIDPGSMAAAPLPCPVAALDPDVGRDAVRHGRGLAALPPREAAAAIGHVYCRALPTAHRSGNGVFYTPMPLVRRLLDGAERAGVDWSRHRVIDPSCGGGAFLVEAATRMMAALGGVEPAIALGSLGSRLRGWDIDPFAVWLAQLSVEAVALRLVKASGRRLPVLTEVRDALSGFEDAEGRWNLAMGNPPFGKIKDTPSIRRRFGRSLYGHPNLYGLFTDLALRLVVRDGGIVAHLTPASFLAGSYFRKLRRLLHETARPVSVDIVDSRRDVFEDVLQEVALSVFKAGAMETGAICAMVRVVPDGLSIEEAGDVRLPDDPEGPWLLPRGQGDRRLVERLRDMPGRLRDWGYVVSTGPLVWNRHRSRLHDEPGVRRVPVVWAEAVTRDGRFVLRATTRNHKPWFEPRGPDDPNLVDRPCVLVQRTTAKEQSRRLISAELPAAVLRRSGGAVTVENHLNMVRPADGSPSVPVSVLAAFLATTTADRVLRCINASVAVSATELEAMPLPPADEIVAAMSGRDPEAAVRRIYGAELAVAAGPLVCGKQP
jgi:adenine-specific DNA-methyltransferase